MRPFMPSLQFIEYRQRTLAPICRTHYTPHTRSVVPPDTVPVHHLHHSLQIKALNKKIRQVEELEAKVTGGNVVPTDEQRQKLARKPTLLAELAEVRRGATRQAILG